MDHDPLWNLGTSTDFQAPYPPAPDPYSIPTPRHSRSVFPPVFDQRSRTRHVSTFNVSAGAVGVSVFVVFLLVMTMVLLFSEEAAEYTVPWIVVACFGSVFAFLLTQQWQ